MPAETHSHGEPASAERLTDLVVEIAGAGVESVDEGTTLEDVGVEDEFAIYDLISAVCEELGERNLTPEDLDLDEISPTMPLQAVAEMLSSVLGPLHSTDGEHQ